MSQPTATTYAPGAVVPVSAPSLPRPSITGCSSL
jgi:hypothetical protein